MAEKGDQPVNRSARQTARLLGISGADPGLENVGPVEDGGGKGTKIEHSLSSFLVKSCRHCAETACMLLRALLASSQLALRRIDGWDNLQIVRDDEALYLTD